MKKVFFISFMFVALSLVAQGYKHFSIENGLLSNRVYKVVQDNRGFIWIATDKGLSKFDGKSFVHFTVKNGLPSNDIWEIFYTQPDKLWFFTRANALGYIQNDKIHLFYGENGELFYPTNIHTDNKSISFYSFGKNYKLIDNKWKRVFENNNYLSSALLHDKTDMAYLNDNQRIISLIYKNDTIKKINLPEGNIQRLGQVNDSLYAVLTDNNLFFVNLNTYQLHKVSNLSRKNPSVFIRIYDDTRQIQISSENFWGKIDENYKISDWTPFDNKHNFTNIFKDKKGNYWVSSYSQGLFFYPKNIVNTKYYLHNHKITFLKNKNNHLLAGTYDEGLFIWDKLQHQFKTLYKTNNYLYDVYFLDPENYVLFGNKECILIQNNQKKEFLNSGKRAIHFQDKYYTTNVNGVLIFDKSLNYLKTVELPDPNVLITYHKRLITGGLNGLYEIKNEKKKKIYAYFKQPVISAKVANSRLLLGTESSGLYVLEKDTIVRIPNTNQLTINDIAIYNDKIWLATQEGVMVYDNKDYQYVKTIRKYDGLVSDQVINIAFYRDSLFSASYNGVSAFKINNQSDLPLQSLYIKNIQYDSVNLKNTSQTPFVKNSNLNISFGAIDFSGQEHNRYYYRLLPVQKKWQQTHSQIIDFSNLSPQHYTLEVKAENPYQQSLKKQISFEITPLWWQTDWAKLLLILFVLFTLISIGYFIRKIELTKQRKKMIAQKELAEFELYALRSQMNPHFVFNSLNAIQYYINDENFDQSETYLVKFSRLVRMIFDFSREKTINLKNELSLLKSYLELEKMRFGDDFNYCFNIDEKIDLDNTEIPTMLLQPIVENAVNHGLFHKDGKGLICMDIKKITQKTIEIQVKDDGVGITKSTEINRKSLKRHLSKSTQILKKRIILLNQSEKWKISYELIDNTHNDNKFNTIVILKITRL